MKRLIVAFLLPLFASCSSATQQTEIEEENISWHEEKVLSLGYEEKNLDLTMEEMIEKKNACKEHAADVFGEEVAINEIRYTQSSYEYAYSPRFDRCFSMMGIRDFAGTSYVIFDVLSEESLFSHFSECKNIHSRPEMTEEEMREQCPEDTDIFRIWEHLIQGQP